MEIPKQLENEADDCFSTNINLNNNSASISLKYNAWNIKPFDYIKLLVLTPKTTIKDGKELYNYKIINKTYILK